MAGNPLLQKGLFPALDVYVARLSSGNNLGEFGPINFVEFQLTQPDPDTITQVSYMKSNRGSALAASQQAKPAEISFVFNSADPQLLSWVFQGTVAAATQQSGSGQSLTFTAYHDKWVYVGKYSLSALTVSGKVDGTDFIVAKEPGLFMALSGGSINDGASVTATASWGATTTGKTINRGANTSQEFYIRGDGINTLNGNKKFRFIVPDAFLAPSGDLGLISDEVVQFAMKGPIAVPTGGSFDFYYEEY